MSVIFSANVSISLSVAKYQNLNPKDDSDVTVYRLKYQCLAWKLRRIAENREAGHAAVSWGHKEGGHELSD